MNKSKTPTKRDLKMLRFEVLSGDAARDPLCEGNYSDVLDYLSKRQLEGLEVIAVDIDSWSTMDPISAKEFVKWYELIVQPQLKDASYSSEVDIYFPSTQLELADDKKM
jgi:hypothetical protein